jgi:hypothetical protein
LPSIDPSRETERMLSRPDLLSNPRFAPMNMLCSIACWHSQSERRVNRLLPSLLSAVPPCSTRLRPCLAILTHPLEPSASTVKSTR